MRCYSIRPAPPSAALCPPPDGCALSVSALGRSPSGSRWNYRGRGTAGLSSRPSALFETHLFCILGRDQKRMVDPGRMLQLVLGTDAEAVQGFRNRTVRQPCRRRGRRAAEIAHGRQREQLLGIHPANGKARSMEGLGRLRVVATTATGVLATALRAPGCCCGGNARGNISTPGCCSTPNPRRVPAQLSV
jgi:hypothetical protein